MISNRKKMFQHILEDKKEEEKKKNELLFHAVFIY